MKNFSFRHAAITGAVVASTIIMWGGLVLPAQAALTTSQVQAIVGLLQAFGVNQPIIANVQAILMGQSPNTNTPNTTPTPTYTPPTTVTPPPTSYTPTGSCTNDITSGIYFSPSCTVAPAPIPTIPPPSTGAAACMTPLGNLVVPNNGTASYSQYFITGPGIYPDITLTLVPLSDPLMRCSNGTWLACNWQGNNCQNYTGKITPTPTYTSPTTVTPIPTPTYTAPPIVTPTPTPTPTVTPTPTGSCVAYTTTYPNGSQISWMGQPGPGAPNYLGLTASQWTCNSGTWINTTPSYTSTPQPPPVSCITSWGTTIASGQSVTGYQSNSLSYGGQCVSQTRTCTNGTLSGTYPYSSCTVAPAPIVTPTPTYTSPTTTSIPNTSSLPTINDTFGKSCSTPGATITVSGGSVCALVCTPVVTSMLYCVNNTWSSTPYGNVNYY